MAAVSSVTACLVRAASQMALLIISFEQLPSSLPPSRRDAAPFSSNKASHNRIRPTHCLNAARDYARSPSGSGRLWPSCSVWR
jgi:hypothetical protein